MHRPTLIILSCIAFIIGIILGQIFLFQPTIFWLIFGIVTFVGAVIVSKNLKIIPIFAGMLLLGIYISGSYIEKNSLNSLSTFQYQKVELVGVVSGEPYWDEDRNYVFNVKNIQINHQDRNGEIKVKTFSSAYKEGQKVNIKGKLFPIRAKPYYQINFAEVVVVDDLQPLLIQLKEWFYTGIDRALPEPFAGFIKGLLVGSRSSLSREFQGLLNNIGLSHIVAVSGYNLTILVVLLQRALRNKWKWGSLVFSIGLIIGFTLITGASSSIVRAAIMAIIFSLAIFYGREMSILVCISITAVIMLALNPTSILNNIGWQLSFLSLIGIVTLAPTIEKILPQKPKLVNEILSVTISAQIATVPYLLYIFGNYSLISLVANAVILPIVPVFMLVGFIATIVGSILPNDAYIAFRPVNFVLQKIFELMHYMNSLKNLNFSIKPDLTTLLTWYSFLVLIGIISYHRNRQSGFIKRLKE